MSCCPRARGREGYELGLGHPPVGALPPSHSPLPACSMGFAFQGGRDSSVFVAEHTLAFTLGRVVATYK